MSKLRPYKRRDSNNKSAPVDWEDVDEQLARVNPDFYDPRFDSLKHVLNVLSSSNAEAELEELREQRANIEQLVGAVVEGYHSGFNKSLHNYSQILRLFTESKLQLESLRRSLEAAKRRLGTQSRHMQAQWQRDLVLTDTLRLLGDIRSIAEVPAAVQRLEEAQEWPQAVSQLLEGCNKLAREELAGVGALRELREELGRRRSALQETLLAEVEARLYRLDPGTQASSSGGSAEAEAPSAAATAGTRLMRRTTSSSNDGEASLAAAGAGLAGCTLPRAVSAAPGGGMVLTTRPSHRRMASGLPALGPLGPGSAVPSTAALSTADGHLVLTEVPLFTLVDCIAQLGGVQEAQVALRQHMPRQLRALVGRALDAFPAARWLPPQEQPAAAQERQRGSEGGQAQPSIPPEVVATAQALMEHVLSCCLQAFQNIARLQSMLALARVPKASSGLELLLALRRRQQAEEGGGGAGASSRGAAAQPAGPLGTEAAKVECLAAWEALQVECQRVLADVFNTAAPAQQQQHEGTGDLPGAGWLASVGEQELQAQQVQQAGSTEPGTLTFALEHEVGDLLSHPAAQMEGNKSAAEEAAAQRGRIRRVLGGHPGGPALVAGLYRLVLQFAEAAERMVASLGAGSNGSSDSSAAGRMAALLSMPWRAGGEAGAAERSVLRGYVESFLRMDFLPAVYVDARARCSTVLDDVEAFKPRTRLRAPYQPTVAEGRPVLPAALAAEGMVQELLSWAAQVPPFATHLAGVVENVLGRVLDAFQQQMAIVAGGSAAGQLAGDLQAVQLMVKEPAAALLGSPIAFFVGRNADAMESFVSSVIAAGFGANDEAVEGELLRRLMAQRPLQPSVLLSAGGDAQRLVAVAALSDSLDYLADVIQACITAGAAGSGSGGPGGASSSAGAAAATGLVPRVPMAGSGAAAAAAGVVHPRTDSWGQSVGGRLRSWRQQRPGLDQGLTEGLVHLADRCRALAGQCARVLRLDLLLLVLFHLQELPRSSYVCGEEEAGEVDECIGALSRAVGRLDADLAPHLPPHKRAYAFGSLLTAAPRVVVWLLPELKAVNHVGVSRMQRMLASLQPALAGVGGGGSAAGAPGSSAGSSRQASTKQFERAKQYYQLLTYSAEGVVQTAVDKPTRWSGAEYLALLAVDVPGRPVTLEHRQQLERVLVDAGRLQRASKPSALQQGIAKGAVATLQGLQQGIAKVQQGIAKLDRRQLGH